MVIRNNFTNNLGGQIFMAYDNEKNEKRPVGNHPGTQQQKDDLR